ncbi:MAG: Unknown protein, partial [uncultured Sulfurovum sp.]
MKRVEKINKLEEANLNDIKKNHPKYRE